jgi:YfiH family protein
MIINKSSGTIYHISPEGVSIRDDTNSKSSYLAASWPDDGFAKPHNVQAFTTLRKGGVSTGDFSEYNLATHVGDNLQTVKTNREKLRTELALPSEPVWLEQVHSNKVIIVDKIDDDKTARTGEIQADASVSARKGAVCVVMTADCLPVFFCNQNGSEVAVAHAGWRGLHAGIISNTVKAMFSSPDEILVSLGPAIGPQAFEVGADVLDAFVAKNSLNHSAFVSTKKDFYLCDIYQLARIELQALGITKIAGGDYCTYRDKQQFYSFRRQQKTGRMASLIWLE